MLWCFCFDLYLTLPLDHLYSCMCIYICMLLHLLSALLTFLIFAFVKLFCQNCRFISGSCVPSWASFWSVCIHCCCKCIHKCWPSSLFCVVTLPPFKSIVAWSSVVYLIIWPCTLMLPLSWTVIYLGLTLCPVVYIITVVARQCTQAWTAATRYSLGTSSL